jgi:hypothetical protein
MCRIGATDPRLLLKLDSLPMPFVFHEQVLKKCAAQEGQNDEIDILFSVDD